MTTTTSVQTVDIIRRPSGFANVPALYRVDNGDIDHDREDVKTYRLPPGYHVAMSQGGLMQIYDPKNEHCDIAWLNNRLRLITSRYTVALAPYTKPAS